MNPFESTESQNQTAVQTRYAPKWRVIGLDDDVTTMDYVVWLLMDVFHKSENDAMQLMMKVHKEGQGTFYAGTRESCELKIEQTQARNKDYNQNLQVVLEEEPV